MFNTHYNSPRMSTTVSTGGSMRRSNAYSLIRIMAPDSELAHMIFRRHPEDVIQVSQITSQKIAVEFYEFEEYRKNWRK